MENKLEWKFSDDSQDSTAGWEGYFFRGLAYSNDNVIVFFRDKL